MTEISIVRGAEKVTSLSTNAECGGPAANCGNAPPSNTRVLTCPHCWHNFCHSFQPLSSMSQSHGLGVTPPQQGEDKNTEEKYLRRIRATSASRIGDDFQATRIMPVSSKAGAGADGSAPLQLLPDRGVEGRGSSVLRGVDWICYPEMDVGQCVWSGAAVAEAAISGQEHTDIADMYLTKARWLMHTLCCEEPHLVWRTRALLPAEWTVDGVFMMVRCNVDAYLLEILHQQ